ncbi:MAG: hypothetical protein IJD28_07130 [Deferribacterales bacterium]|nr:hypothetical protein [Deferribacterales bacterium]
MERSSACTCGATPCPWGKVERVQAKPNGIVRPVSNEEKASGGCRQNNDWKYDVLGQNRNI